jgi:hypothetical protein
LEKLFKKSFSKTPSKTFNAFFVLAKFVTTLPLSFIKSKISNLCARHPFNCSRMRSGAAKTLPALPEKQLAALRQISPMRSTNFTFCHGRNISLQRISVALPPPKTRCRKE